jgi:serine/threonine protein kinase
LSGGYLVYKHTYEEPAEVERRFGKYTLVERLGGGGMAEVYRARLHGPQGFEKDVALKLILPQFSDEPEFVKMFVHEATVAARLDHTSIVRIHEFDVIDGTYYIAMELVEGKDLRALLARAHQMDRKLSVPQALLIALEVARGLAFAHGELVANRDPIIHRDISPHNIIISRAGEVKITDFGIAKAASAASLTRTGVVKGKAAYMSPEQARGEPVDPRSDIFSLGCVIWEMLTGQRLFTGENDYAILEKLHKSPIAPPSQYDPAVPPELDQLVLKCLERDPDKRVQSAAELVRELDRLLVATGTERTTLLADLYHSLFTENPRHTQMLPSTPAWPAPARPSADSSPPPAPEEPALEGEPAGPEGPGDLPEEERPIAGPPTEPDLNAATEIMTPRTVSRTQLLAADDTSGQSRSRLLKAAAAGALVLLLAAVVWWLAAGYLSPQQQPQAEPAAAYPETAAVEKPAEPSPAVTEPLPASPAEVITEKAAPPAERAAPSPPVDAAAARAEATRPAVETAAEPMKKAEKLAQSQGKLVDSAPKNQPPLAYGTLELNAIPWAKVYRKGRLLGVTPLRGVRLPAGEHSLLLVNEELKVRLNEKIIIEAKQVTRKVVDLRPAKP